MRDTITIEVDISKIKKALGMNGKAGKSAKNGNGKRAAVAKGADKTSKTAAQMRCRFGIDTEERCRARSKGPRFHYLCAEHAK